MGEIKTYGTVGILNVGHGDTKLTFDKDDPAECIRAARIVKDMLRRGYALLIDTGEKTPEGKPRYRRAVDFDETTNEYIIADLDPTAAFATNTDEAASEPEQHKRGRKRVAAADTRAVAVPHRAGG